MKTIAYFWLSPIPSHRSDSGIQASDGNGRMMDITGWTIQRSGRKVPSRIPSGMPIAAESRKPRRTRRALSRM
jgi:hypothetical protein